MKTWEPLALTAKVTTAQCAETTEQRTITSIPPQLRSAGVVVVGPGEVLARAYAKIAAEENNEISTYLSQTYENIAEEGAVTAYLKRKFDRKRRSIKYRYADCIFNWDSI